jgi:homogentisate 1,2-dioxygenase
MLERKVVGSVPAKHHITHYSPTGQLYQEECFTRLGFEGAYTIMYHQYRPQTHVLSECHHGWRAPVEAKSQRLAKRHFLSQDLPISSAAPVDSRVPLLFNDDIIISVLKPNQSDPCYFSNGDGDDLFYIHKGKGILRSPLGDLAFEEKDYVYVPKALTHRFILEEGVEQYWLSLECKQGLDLLKQFRNPYGQLRMDAPYCHRDFKYVQFTGPIDEGVRELVVKREHQFFGFEYQFNPLDVVGWDGTVYPWAFPILNFQPRAGLVHLPPTWHGTFACQGVLICSFVPRMVDFHPQAIPCPYPHSSADIDEFIFYCHGDFTSRKGVSAGSISFHPIGIPHGPHPGAYEKSIGAQKTSELAVMLDCAKNLKVTEQACAIEDQLYQNSFLENP